MIEIVSIEYKEEVDTCPDLSWLGKYTNNEVPSSNDLKRGNAMDRGKGSKLTKEYQYFIPANQVEDTRKWFEEHGKTANEAEVLARKQNFLDYHRMEDYDNGWCMMGITAVAKIKVEGVIQKITSGGLYGIESDSSDEYKEEVKQEQLKDLKSILLELGVEEKEISRAISEIEEK